jgi:hypothetical protein
VKLRNSISLEKGEDMQESSFTTSEEFKREKHAWKKTESWEETLL